MVSWFAKRAPIRVKFMILLAIYLMFGMVACAAAIDGVEFGGHVSPFLLIGAPVLATLGTAIVTLVARGLICNPYVETVLRMEGLAAGDLATKIDHTDNTDCVGRMTRAMDVFRRNAEEVLASCNQRVMADALKVALGRVAKGDLTCRIDTPFPANYEPVRADFNDAVGALHEAMAQVSQATGGIRSGTGEIRQASDDLSQRTEQQAASLEETAAAMDEITATVRRTAEDATRADGAVRDTRTEAEQGGKVVRRAVEAMHGIERSSSEISEIISVIDGIAFQTNLLALNAGVEAARAGDAGKGFAVVASEVRALAQRSAEAAKDVKTRIMASTEQVEAGVELVTETGKALERIIGRITEISELVSAITVSAGQQSSGLTQVAEGVNQMDKVTQQNAAMVEQATAAARSLASEADELARQVTRFNTGQAAAPARASTPVVHELQRRVAEAGRRILRPATEQARLAPAAAGDWSGF